MIQVIPEKLLLGGGVSSLAVARYLHKIGEPFYFVDDRELPQDKQNTFAALGGIYLRQPLASWPSHSIVTSPGVPLSHPILAEARRRGLEITSEIELAFSILPDRVKIVAVTGTNGKSTVTAMVSYLFNAMGHPSAAVGNIGDPLLDAASEHARLGALSIELSSYQLEHLNHFRCDAAIITNITPDHLERHGSMKNYALAKAKVIDFLKPSAALVTTSLVVDQLEKAGLVMPKTIDLIVMNEREGGQSNGIDFPIELEFLAGDHNQHNAAVSALAVASVIKRPAAELLSHLREFKPLPYRSEIVTRFRGFPIINDSKATNVASTVALLKGQTGPYILLLGGKPKGESFQELKIFGPAIRELLAFGEASNQIVSELKELPVKRFETLADAMVYLVTALKGSPCEVCFSPACASFDEFTDFNHRGLFFTTYIENHLH